MLLHKLLGLIIGIRKPRASTFKIWSLNYSTHFRKCAVCILIGKPLGFKDIAGSFEFCTLNNKGLTPYGRFVQNTFKSNFHIFFYIHIFEMWVKLISVFVNHWKKVCFKNTQKKTKIHYHHILLVSCSSTIDKYP